MSPPALGHPFSPSTPTASASGNTASHDIFSIIFQSLLELIAPPNPRVNHRARAFHPYSSYYYYQEKEKDS